MRPVSFVEGVLLAVLLAVAGAVAYLALGLFLVPALALKAIITGLGACYAGYLMRRAGVRRGRLVVPVLWLAGSAAAWWWAGSVLVYFALHASALWGLRAVYFHARALPALLDLGLTACAVVAAVAAARHSASVLLTVWTFFLVQALFVCIPTLGAARAGVREDSPGARFAAARRRAETALARLHDIT